MNIDLRNYEEIDSRKQVVLSNYDSGTCCISATCPDSLRLAQQLAQYNIEILYIEDGSQYGLDSADTLQFRDTGKVFNIKEPDTFNYVPVLYLKKNNKYYGTWTTHHGTKIDFKTASVYNINGPSTKLKL